MTHSSPLTAVAPPWLRTYQRAWLGRDIVAGVTLAAVAIPETMGYTSIAETPVVTGLYTIIFPTIIFALLASSRLLVVGADSATAAVLAAGLTAAAIPGVTAGSEQWLAYTSLVALMCGGLLILARVLRLGFIGDFLSASVLIGFLTGVGVQVFSGQLPDMLGIPKGTGGWVEQQWDLLTNLSSISWPTFVYGAGTVALILGFKRFLPRVPGAIVAVVLFIAASSILDSSANGVAVIGTVQGGFPPIGLPQGISLSNFGACLGIAFSCFVLIIAQSAATSRSFAMKHGQKVDVNRDIVGLSGANFAAGLSGTFVVNGSPTKTQILDEQKGRSQIANLTMSVITLLVVLFFTSILTNMPSAVLAGIVFVIGIDLVDIAGLRRISRMRRSEFVIALLTAVVVCAIGVEQGIIVAIVASIVELVRRQYQPANFVVETAVGGTESMVPATAGTQSAPGLIVFRYDARLFYANANRFVDELESLIEAAPDPVTWVILDAGAIADIDFSASIAFQGLLDYLSGRNIHFAVAGADSSLLQVLSASGLDEGIGADNLYPHVAEAVAAYSAQKAS